VEVAVKTMGTVLVGEEHQVPSTPINKQMTGQFIDEAAMMTGLDRTRNL